MFRTKAFCILAAAFLCFAFPAGAADTEAAKPLAAVASNAEMTAIFDADQADRQAKPIDWKVVGPADEKRRARTQQLLAAGALQTADDFWEAAFVFQHGDTANSYLLAHILAEVSVAKGKKEAIWISAATLDRYLLQIGQKQVLGTQYMRTNGAWTQEPYDRELISDALRRQLHVGTQAEQAEQMKRLQEEK